MAPKKRTVVRTQSAENDLYGIRLHLEMHSPETARNTILDLNRKIHDIAAKGGSGSKRMHVPAYVRAFPYEKHCFYFTANTGTLTLLRVLAQRQDVDDIIFESDD